MTAPYADVDAVDLFAGPGGWSVAAARLGLVEVGVENDPSAVATRLAAGHRTIATSVTKLDPRMFSGVPGLIASPPCQTFSQAGGGSGRRQLDLVLRAVKRMGVGEWPAEEIEETHDPRTALVLQPLRWALLMRPEWIAFEQVPAVLPVWEACAEVLRVEGWNVATGVVTSEQYGVPQTRRRAVLLAHRTRSVALPTPTHSRYHSRTPDRIDEGLPRWVSMAEALGWAEGRVVTSNYGTGGDPTNRGQRSSAEPSATITSKADRNMVSPIEVVVQLATGTRPSATIRREDEPSPTLAFGHDAASHVWTPEGLTPDEVVDWKRIHGGDAVNNQSGTPYDVDAQVATPATALAGRDLVGFRGPNANRFNGSSKSRNDGIRLAVEEAAVLQTFPADYPWQGDPGRKRGDGKSAKFQQIGNAVPPLLAEALLSAVIGVPFDPPSAGRPSGGLS